MLWSSSRGQIDMTGRTAVRVVALSALVLLTNACGQSAGTTTTTGALAVTSTTAGPVGSEQVALAFFEAWRTGDQETMGQLSEPAALTEADDLSDLTYEAWVPEPCEGAAGTVYCSWTSAAGTLAIGVRNIEEPHLVTSVRILDS
jgi:hypothetical protein